MIQVLPTIHVTSASERSSGGSKVADALQAAVESAEVDKGRLASALEVLWERAAGGEVRE